MQDNCKGGPDKTMAKSMAVVCMEECLRLAEVFSE